MTTVSDAWNIRRYQWHEWILDTKGWDEMGASDMYVAAMEFFDRKLLEKIQSGKTFGVSAVDSSLVWFTKPFDEVFALWLESPEHKKFYPDVT